MRGKSFFLSPYISTWRSVPSLSSSRTSPPPEKPITLPHAFGTETSYCAPCASARDSGIVVIQALSAIALSATAITVSTVRRYRSPFMEWLLSAEEVAADRFPHLGGEPEALRVHALVVTVEHQWILGVGDARRVQAEAVRRHALPPEELRVGPAGGHRRHDRAAGHECRGHPPQRVAERRVERAQRALLAAQALDLDPTDEIADRFAQHRVHLVCRHPGQRTDVDVDLHRVRDDVDL